MGTLQKPKREDEESPTRSSVDRYQALLKMIKDGDLGRLKKFLQDPQNEAAIAEFAGRGIVPVPTIASKQSLDSFVSRRNSIDTSTGSRSPVDRAMTSRR